jgi:uncharacterized protein involved in exopolysaccharide biosynthesis
MPYSAAMNMPTNRPNDLYREPSLFTLLVRRWRLASGIIVSCTLVSVVMALLTTPIYRATVILLPTQNRSSMSELEGTIGGLGSIGSLVGLSGGQSQQTVEAVALLESRALGEAFIKDHNLLPRLFASRWDAKRATWRISWRHALPPTLFDGYSKFNRKVRHVSQDKETGLVTLEVDWTDPSKAAQWANEMVKRVNDAMRKRALDEANASIELLSKELQQAPAGELRDAIARTIDSYVKSRVFAKVRPDYAFRIVDAAVPPGPNDFIRPNRFLYVVSGLCIGLMVAALACLASERFPGRQSIGQSAPPLMGREQSQ